MRPPYATYNQETGIYTSTRPHLYAPDSIDIHDWVFDYQPTRSDELPRPDLTGRTLFIDSVTSSTATFEAVKAQTEAFAKVLHAEYGLGRDQVSL